VVSAVGRPDLSCGLRRCLLGAAACVAAALAISPTAAALQTVRNAPMPGAATFSTGFVDDQLFENPSLSVENLWFGRAASVGPARNSQSKSWVRLSCYWIVVAPQHRAPGFQPTNPADPHYNWSGCDAEVTSAAAAHENILLLVSYAPTWAEGPHQPSGQRPGVWDPNAKEFGQFARAVATRYSGRFPSPLELGHKLPRVTHFQAWNEPNLPTSLAPEWRRAANGTNEPLGPTLYRGLLNSFYSNVKAVQPHATVLAGGLGPYGDPPSEGNRMDPVQFLQQLLCVHGSKLSPARCPIKAHLDGVDVHPYSYTPTLSSANPLDVSVPDIHRLYGVLHAAEHARRVLPAGPKPVWATEVTWNTNPPSAGSLAPARQARYLALAWYEEWRQRVAVGMWYLVRDPGFALGGLTGAGIYFSNGKPKPAAQADRFPFVALPQREHAMIIWGRAPSPGTVTIELRRAGRWRALFRVRTTNGGVFHVLRAMQANVAMRAIEGRTTSLAWNTGGAPS
jgi:hypothetical protein